LGDSGTIIPTIKTQEIANEFPSIYRKLIPLS